MATLINTNDEMKIIKTVRSLEKSGLLVKDVSETEAKNEAKEQKEVFLLSNLLAGKRAIATSQGHQANMPEPGTIREGEGSIRVDEETIRVGRVF